MYSLFKINSVNCIAIYGQDSTKNCLPFLYHLFTLSSYQVNPRVTLRLPILYLLVT